MLYWLHALQLLARRFQQPCSMDRGFGKVDIMLLLKDKISVGASRISSFIRRDDMSKYMYCSLYCSLKVIG